MSNIKKISKGQILAQNGEGSLVSQMALTKQATYAIEGVTLTNRVYLATGRGPWNMKSTNLPVVRINGVVSGCAVTGGASNDNLEVAAGVVNVNGVAVAVGADASNAITRGASSKYAVHALCVDNAGTLSVVAGTDGDSLDLTGGFGGAGQKPLVATTLAVIAYAVTYGATAAVIPAADIYLGENANVSYRIDPLRSGIVLLEALEANHTGPVARGVYAAFYDLASALLAVGTLEDATLTIKRAAPVATPNHDTRWDEFVSMPTLGWDLNVKKWRADQYWIDKMLDPSQDVFYLKMLEDSADAYAYYGFGILNGDYSISTKRGPVSESLKFQGTGELRRA